MAEINKARRTFIILLLCIISMTFISPLAAQDRFPRPDFESDYELPLTTAPGPRSSAFEIIDIVVLIAALSLASWFAVKKRTRRGLFWLAVFSLIYFGFVRAGCVCSVGSIQNVFLSLFDASYTIPFTVLIFFLAPLLFTLFFGRTFCASVCPLGAVQEVLAFKPARIRPWIGKILETIPVIYLALAVLLAATGSAFLICRYDPFVSIFRLDGRALIITITAVFVILSMMTARPYCRFLCPYGIILGWMASLSGKHATVSPDICIQCRLCEKVCPVDAIDFPSPEKSPESSKKGTRRLAILLLILPVIVFAGGFTMSSAHRILSRFHPQVRLAERIHMEETGMVTGTTKESEAFRSQRVPADVLYENAAVIQNQFKKIGWFTGGFIGLMVMLKVIGMSVRRKRTDYQADPARCVSCGRCFAACPKEHERIRNIKADKEIT